MFCVQLLDKNDYASTVYEVKLNHSINLVSQGAFSGTSPHLRAAGKGFEPQFLIKQTTEWKHP